MVVSNSTFIADPLRLEKRRSSSAGADNRMRLALWGLNNFLNTVLPERNSGVLGALYGDRPTMPLPLQEEAKGRIRLLLSLLRDAHSETDADLRELKYKVVNEQLSRYNAQPVLLHNPHDASPTLWMKPAQPPLSLIMPSPQEIAAAWDLVFLATDGLLFDLNDCSCGNLFKPSRNGQQNCSTACSKREYSKTDKFREQRRNYMRKRYHSKNG